MTKRLDECFADLKKMYAQLAACRPQELPMPNFLLGDAIARLVRKPPPYYERAAISLEQFLAEHPTEKLQ